MILRSISHFSRSAYTSSHKILSQQTLQRTWFGLDPKPSLFLWVLWRYPERYFMAAPWVQWGSFAKVGNLMISIGNVALSALLEEFEISNNGNLVKPMFKGSWWNISSGSHAGFGWHWARRCPYRKVFVLHDMVNKVRLRKLDLPIR